MKKSLQRFIPVMLIFALLASCHSLISYQNAYHRNKDKFQGDEEKDALYLVDLENYRILAHDLAKLATKKCYAKEVYDFSKKAAADYNELQYSLDPLAVLKGIKLPNSIAEEQGDIYQSLYKIDDKKAFDMPYLEQMSAAVDTLTNMMTKYSVNGHDDKIKSFSSKHLDLVKKQQDTLKELQKTISTSKTAENTDKN